MTLPIVEIQVAEPFAEKVDSGDCALIERTILAVAAYEGVAEGVEVSVLVADDATLASLNREYRGIDAPTDVLAFPGGSPPGGDAESTFALPPEGPRHLGDIAISYERVLAQAAEYEHSTRRELAYLVAHAMLHLLGYDHHGSLEATAAMRAREEAVMEELGLGRKTSKTPDGVR